MDLARAETLARTLIPEHAPGWSFRWDNAKTLFGRCWEAEQAISLSRPLVQIRDEASVRDVILHELAHVKAGPGHWHDLVWQRWARRLGADPSPCSPGPILPTTWTGTCRRCATTVGRYRLSKRTRAGFCDRCWTKDRVRSMFTWTRTTPTTSSVAAARTKKEN